jgi:hypothetical protein
MGKTLHNTYSGFRTEEAYLVALAVDNNKQAYDLKKKFDMTSLPAVKAFLVQVRYLNVRLKIQRKTPIFDKPIHLTEADIRELWEHWSAD